MANTFDDLPPLFNIEAENNFDDEPIDDLDNSTFYPEDYPGNQSPRLIPEHPLFENSFCGSVSQQPAFRRNKKDDFDYNAYIREELERQGEDVSDPSVKRRLIQKIRNRMSAQRSRIRQKSATQLLEQENEGLKILTQQLSEQLTIVRRENSQLKETIKKLETSRTAESVSEAEDSLSISSMSELVRINSTGRGLSAGLVFLAIAAVVCLVMPPAAKGNGLVKAGGVVPFIGTKFGLASNRQLLTLEDQCLKKELDN